ncbi:LysR family transcriptional regulator ArgP [Kiloniella laminariae]|uniref:LysR family transcriptional regulator ArgP n=1 Tax=Kiloniella laminariae TaxID=454162 RepID=A0ABT4LIT3_9PROT|nr:LysR family transcriptional regulator ArgP [Kiloniella laminariae]MCZ4281015.1 LysR family transcriptional regulator ArgP [Kiloniella laminariae]
MLDYRLLATLTAILEEGSFEKAAQRLFITQSAVSQRLRQLEDNLGQTLVVRSTPLAATTAGQRLLKHYKQVSLLESELDDDLKDRGEAGFNTLTIGLNADSIGTWFLPAIQNFVQDNKILLDLKVDDQEQTHHLLRTGEVLGCISASSSAVQGCRCIPLGQMIYRPLASPDFVEKYAPNGLTTENASHIPVAVFNRKDPLQHRYLEQRFGVTRFPHHLIPACDGFISALVKGFAYGLVPDQQSKELMQNKELVSIDPECEIPVPLYWHVWNLQTSLMQQLTRSLTTTARKSLTPIISA